MLWFFIWIGIVILVFAYMGYNIYMLQRSEQMHNLIHVLHQRAPDKCLQIGTENLRKFFKRVLYSTKPISDYNYWLSELNKEKC